MIKVSVIVPVFNSEKYIGECLDSLVNQTLKDIEIIIIDDASIDNSLKIIKEYAKKYSNIKVYQNDQNRGQGFTRNVGLSLAKGEYIGFVDDDDYIDFTMYETMYNGAKENNNPDIVSCGIKFVHINDKFQMNSDLNSSAKGYIYHTSKHPEKIFWESPSCCNKIFKKDLIDKYRFLELRIWEDIAFTYSMLIKANIVLNFHDNFYNYRRDVTKGVSSRSYHSNAPLEDIFTISDEISMQAKRYHKERIFKKVILLLQLSVCLERLSEIKEWNINEEDKNKIMIHFYQKVIEKYGDIKQVDNALLSSKVDLFLLDRIEEMINKRVVK